MKISDVEVVLVEWDDTQSSEDREEQGKKLLDAGFKFWAVLKEVEPRRDVSCCLFVRPLERYKRGLPTPAKTERKQE